MGIAMENVNITAGHLTMTLQEAGLQQCRASSQGSITQTVAWSSFVLGKMFNLQQNDSPPQALSLCNYLRVSPWYIRMLAPSWENVENDYWQDVFTILEGFQAGLSENG